MTKEYESAQAISFIEKPDGAQAELSAEERQAAADAFKELTDNLFLTHMDETTNYDRGVLLKNATSNLLLSVENQDGSHLTIGVKSNTAEEYDFSSPCELSIQEVDTHRLGHEYYRYELARDGSEVIRVDVGDMYEKMQRSKSLGGYALRDDMSADELVQYVESQIKTLDNEIENAELEKRMRLNRQPVTKEEIAQLRAVVMQAKPEKAY